ncbi:MAG TPA: APC family permease [Rhizomicrobium sp.]
MNDPNVESFGYRQELKRSLSLFDLLVYGLVFIVPGAPVAVFCIVYNASHGMVPLVYAIGLVAMVFTALSYMTMSRAIPVAGSVYAYAGHALGPAAGFFAGWAILLDYLLLPTLNYVASAIAMHAALPILPPAAVVVALLAFATVVNYFGIETTARANVWLLVGQLVVLAIFTVVAVVALRHGVAGAHLSLLPLFNPREASFGLLFGALSLAVLSFLGFDAISTLSEESRGGSRAVARATMASLCVCAVLFVAQTWLASLFVLGRTGFAPGDPTNAAFYDIANAVGGYGLKFLLTVPVSLLAGVAGALTAQAATARLLYSMARDGQLPRALAYVSPGRAVPDRAIFAVAAVTLALGVFLVDKLELLTSMVSFGALVGFFLLHVSVMVYFLVRKRSRDWLRHLVVPVIGLVIVATVLVNAEANAKIAGLAWMAAGVVLFAVLRVLGRSTALPVDP